MGKTKAKGGKKHRKHGREKDKRLRRGSPISKYVQGLMTFEQYVKTIQIKKKPRN